MKEFRMKKKDELFYDYYVDLYNLLIKENKPLYIDVVTKLHNIVILEAKKDQIMISSIYLTDRGNLKIRKNGNFNEFTDNYRLKVYEKMLNKDYQFIDFTISFEDIKKKLENEKGSVKIKLEDDNDFHFSIKRKEFYNDNNEKVIKDYFEIKKANNNERVIEITEHENLYSSVVGDEKPYGFINSKTLFAKFLLELKNDRFI